MDDDTNSDSDVDKRHHLLIKLDSLIRHGVKLSHQLSYYYEADLVELEMELFRIENARDKKRRRELCNDFLQAGSTLLEIVTDTKGIAQRVTGDDVDNLASGMESFDKKKMMDKYSEVFSGMIDHYRKAKKASGKPDCVDDLIRELMERSKSPKGKE